MQWLRASFFGDRTDSGGRLADSCGGSPDHHPTRTRGLRSMCESPSSGLWRWACCINATQTASAASVQRLVVTQREPSGYLNSLGPCRSLGEPGKPGYGSACSFQIEPSTVDVRAHRDLGGRNELVRPRAGLPACAGLAAAPLLQRQSGDYRVDRAGSGVSLAVSPLVSQHSQKQARQA